MPLLLFEIACFDLIKTKSLLIHLLTVLTARTAQAQSLQPAAPRSPAGPTSSLNLSDAPLTRCN